MSSVHFHSGKSLAEIQGCEYMRVWVLLEQLHKAVSPGIDQEESQHNDVVLNTAIIMGSPLVQFLACFAGLSDPYFWINGGDRKEFAILLRYGLDIGILRKKVGWGELITLLMETEELPIVTTYGGNIGPITSTIQAGDPNKIAKLLDDFRGSASAKWRQVGPANLHIPRFGDRRHAFSVSS